MFCIYFQLTLAIFAMYVNISPDNKMTAEVAFVTMAIVSVVDVNITMLPQVVSYGGQSIVSARRIFDFTQMDELKEDEGVSILDTSDNNG